MNEEFNVVRSYSDEYSFEIKEGTLLWKKYIKVLII
jgi:hypothetical protein